MSTHEEGITPDVIQIWKTLCTRPGWWTAVRMANHYAPCFTVEEVQAHFMTLAKSNFVDTDTSELSNKYAVTAKSQPLPGLEEYMQAALDNASKSLPVAEKRSYDVMHGPVYTHTFPPIQRTGANAHEKFKSAGHFC